MLLIHHLEFMNLKIVKYTIFCNTDLN